MKTANEIKEFILNEYNKKFKGIDDRSSWHKINKEIECFEKNNFLQEFYSIYEIINHIKNDGEPYQIFRAYNTLLSSYVLGITNQNPYDDELNSEIYLGPNYEEIPHLYIDVRPKYLPTLFKYIVDKYVPDEWKEKCKLKNPEIYLSEYCGLSLGSDLTLEFFKLAGPIEIDWKLVFDVLSSKNLTYKKFKTPLLGILEVDVKERIDFIKKTKPKNKYDLYRIFTLHIGANYKYFASLIDEGVDINYIPSSDEDIYSILKASGISKEKIDQRYFYRTKKSINKNEWELIKKQTKYPEICAEIIQHNSLFSKASAIADINNMARMLTLKLKNPRKFYDTYFASMISKKAMKDALCFTKEIKTILSTYFKNELYINRGQNELFLACAMLLEKEEVEPK